MTAIVLTKAAGGGRRRMRSKLFQLRSYNAWRALLERCRNPNHAYAKHYSGAGITVCERWEKYANFVADMGEPAPNMQIDRIDPAGNYEPENCRWATAAQNTANRRGWSVSGLKGVYKRPSGRFAAVMKIGKWMVTIGTFDDAALAAGAYDALAKEWFGEFALTNAMLGTVES